MKFFMTWAIIVINTDVEKRWETCNFLTIPFAWMDGIVVQSIIHNDRVHFCYCCTFTFWSRRGVECPWENSSFIKIKFLFIPTTTVLYRRRPTKIISSKARKKEVWLQWWLNFVFELQCTISPWFDDNWIDYFCDIMKERSGMKENLLRLCIRNKFVP